MINPQQKLRTLLLVLLVALLNAGCSNTVRENPAVRSYLDARPVDLSGSWERDYSRGDDVNLQLGRLFRKLNRTSRDQRFSNRPALIISQREASSIVALAQLAEFITRPTVLTITHGENELLVEREGDYAIVCEFYDGLAHGTETQYGTEACGWLGQQFISRLGLPDGTGISHRFTISPDAQSLHVATTVSSGTAGVPFTLNRFYTRFEPLPGEANCIETLSRKRVCTLQGTSP